MKFIHLLPAMPFPSKFLSYLLIATLQTSLTTLATGQVVVYEGFSDYTTGEAIQFKSGGSGFSSPWSPRASLLGVGSGIPPGPSNTILPESLSYTDGVHQLTTSGGSLHITGQHGNIHMARAIDPALVPNPGPDPKLNKTTYISFLARRGGEPVDPSDPVWAGNYPWGSNLYPRAAGINLYGIDHNNEVMGFLIGNVSNKANSDVWRFSGEDLDGRQGGLGPHAPNVAFGEGNHTAFIVLRISHGAGAKLADRIDSWFNPLLISEQANIDSGHYPIRFDWSQRDRPQYIQPAYIGLEAGNASSNRPHAELTFDEFRVGSTWEDVTPLTALPAMWAGYPIDNAGWVSTGENFMGLLYVLNTPWIFSYSFNTWIHLPESSVTENGAWTYILK